MLHLQKEHDIIAFSTERGFVDMDEPYQGFNITWYTDDDAQHVADCRRDMCQMLEIDDQHLVLPRQVHDTKVAEVTAGNLGDRFEGIDALITTLPRTCIGVSTADCVPILMYDARTRAIAAAHAGWRGTVARIGRKTIEAMQQQYGTKPEELKIVIGPSIGPDAFEVGDEVYDAFAQEGFDMTAISCRRPTSNGIGEKWHIDLPECNRLQLLAADLLPQNVNVSPVCTFQQADDYFSARRLGINSGRIFTGALLRHI